MKLQRFSTANAIPRSTRTMLAIMSLVCIACAYVLMDSIVDLPALIAFSLMLCSLALLFKIIVVQSEEQLHFEETLEAVTDIYWQWDLISGDFHYHGALAQFLGYEDRRPSDGFWREIIHPIDRPLQKYHLLRHLRDESIPYYGEYRFLNEDHQYEWFAGRGKVVRRNEKNQPLLMVGSLEHIQPRKDLEQTLLQAHKMKALGQLTAGIAHDFNNILASVLGYAELAIDSHSPKKMQEYARLIHQAGGRAREVVSQLLDYSRARQSELQTLDLKHEIESTSPFVRSALPSSIKVRYELGTAEHLTTADTNQLRRIILNLCLNAKEAMGEAGILTISLERRQIAQSNCGSCQQPIDGAYNVLSIADTGCGIQSHVKQRLFEPFFTTKSFGDGMGMGLSVVHGIVHELDGHLLVNSESEMGTRVELLLPITQSEQTIVNTDLPLRTGSKI